MSNRTKPLSQSLAIGHDQPVTVLERDAFLTDVALVRKADAFATDRSNVPTEKAPGPIRNSRVRDPILFFSSSRPARIFSWKPGG